MCNACGRREGEGGAQSSGSGPVSSPRPGSSTSRASRLAHPGPTVASGASCRGDVTCRLPLPLECWLIASVMLNAD